jgi:ParB/RepB/Spo0J family partition protein
VNVVRLPLDSVTPDPNQPRKFFGKEELGNLAANIAEHGVLEPILVRTNGDDDTYIIIAGERRWRASKIAEVPDIPAIIRDDIHALGTLDEVAISENTSRQDLNAMEEAKAFDRLQSERGFDTDEIARKIGRSPAFVLGRLSLLNLDPALQRLVEVGQLGPLTGQTIARLPRNHQFTAMRFVGKPHEQGGIGDLGLKGFVDQLIARLEQPELFAEDQAPARKHEAVQFRDKFEKAIDAATAAINVLVQQRTNTLMIDAMSGDFDIYWERLKMLEQECRRIRTAIESAKATNSILQDALL